ncbi:Uncharacterised protein [Vibrio cholerae]|nr:Uncharacterised protein [Vibrio cholerae]
MCAYFPAVFPLPHWPRCDAHEPLLEKESEESVPKVRF